MATHQTIKIPNGITVCTETNTVSLDVFATSAWPWSGKKWPFKGDRGWAVSFYYESEDSETFNLAQIDGDISDVDEEQLKAMSHDCESILKGVLGGCAFALQNLLSDRWHAALECAKDDGFKSGRNVASWIDQDLFGGRAKDGKAAARRFLKGIDDGDPEILFMIPSSPLSGEWAGDRTSKDIVCNALSLDDGEFDIMSDIVCALDMEDSFQSMFEQICNVFEESYCDSAQETLVKAAKSAIWEEHAK
jgi:hypothetical protein